LNPKIIKRSCYNTLIPLLCLISFLGYGCKNKKEQLGSFGLVIDGGAGSSADSMTTEFKAESEIVMKSALKAGYEILNSGGASLDAVNASINILEGSPLFNAGKGAVFTHEGTHELDASIMDGNTLNTGAVAGVKHTKNPINLARLIMDKTEHVMMAGEGAELFGKDHGFEHVEQDYFFTEKQKASLERVLAEQDSQSSIKTLDEYCIIGTVEAVALDKSGNLAAGTSTGGMTNKKCGRVGDSPIIGAGTYASNNSCAVSATGHGEYFIRLTIARDIAALMEYKDLTAEEASRVVIHEKLEELGGRGGVIVIDREGNIATPFNTDGMRRGYVDSDGNLIVKIAPD
jgi:beta-aspartyl-peptidase (threonine type)